GYAAAAYQSRGHASADTSLTGKAALASAVAPANTGCCCADDNAKVTMLARADAMSDEPSSKIETSGESGSPSATTTIPGRQLPAPDLKFGGKIERTARQSKPWWPPRIVPPKGAPNVLLIMTDDSGYGVPGTFGGVIPTPALDRVAK